MASPIRADNNADWNSRRNERSYFRRCFPSIVCIVGLVNVEQIFEIILPSIGILWNSRCWMYTEGGKKSLWLHSSIWWRYVRRICRKTLTLNFEIRIVLLHIVFYSSWRWNFSKEPQVANLIVLLKNGKKGFLMVWRRVLTAALQF